MRWADRMICFLIYHAEFEHEVSIWQVRGWKADLEDLLPYISRGDRTQSWNAWRYCWWHWWLCWSENNHLWPSYYCIFIVFSFGDNSWSSGHLSYLYYLIIWRENWCELPGESWVLLYFSGFIFWFMFTLWWVMFTRCSINCAGECIWLSELCNGKLVRDYTGCVICRRGDLVKGLFVRRGDLVKGRSLEVTKRRRRRLRRSRSLV